MKSLKNNAGFLANRVYWQKKEGGARISGYDTTISLQQDDPYRYPNGVLKNKFNIQDQQELNACENFTRFKNIPVAQNAVKNWPIDTLLSHEGALEIHKIVLGELYDFAGKVRVLDISRPASDEHSNVMFSRYSFIQEDEEAIFKHMHYDFTHGWGGKTPEERAEKLADYYIQLYKVHACREGNTVRLNILFDEIADRLDLTLRLTSISKKNVNVTGNLLNNHKKESYNAMSGKHSFASRIRMQKKDSSLNLSDDVFQKYLRQHNDVNTNNFYEFLQTATLYNGKPLLEFKKTTNRPKENIPKKSIIPENFVDRTEGGFTYCYGV